jgi:hypothetical protein
MLDSSPSKAPPRIFLWAVPVFIIGGWDEQMLGIFVGWRCIMKEDTLFLQRLEGVW